MTSSRFLPRSSARRNFPTLVECVDRFVVLSLLLATLILDCGRAAADDVVIETESLSVTIAGAPIKLEAISAKPAGASGKLPIALIVPGLPTASQTNLSAADQMLTARDFARRGWLAAVVLRRGYGRSAGAKPQPVPCDVAAYRKKLAADADDLEAALAALARRPDADSTRAIALGNASAGAAVVALSARNPDGLSAAISISGGLQSEMSCAWDKPLVNVLQEFGRQSRVPNFWLYAKNDSVFTEDLADRMHAAFLDAGGDVTFVTFDPVGTEGQALFTARATRHLWLAEVDGFLRAHQLPTWTRADLNRIMTKLNYKPDLLNSSALHILEQYFADSGEKALAHSTTTAFIGNRTTLWGAMARPSLDLARAAALALCNKESTGCVIVMENQTWVGD